MTPSAATQDAGNFAGTMTAKLKEQFEAGLLSGQELRPDFTIAQPVHRYKPLLNYVAAGEAAMADLERPMADVVPEGCTWIRDSAAAVDPDASIDFYTRQFASSSRPSPAGRSPRRTSAPCTAP